MCTICIICTHQFDVYNFGWFVHTSVWYILCAICHNVHDIQYAYNPRVVKKDLCWGQVKIDLTTLQSQSKFDNLFGELKTCFAKRTGGTQYLL